MANSKQSLRQQLDLPMVKPVFIIIIISNRRFVMKD